MAEEHAATTTQPAPEYRERRSNSGLYTTLGILGLVGAGGLIIWDATRDKENPSVSSDWVQVISASYDNTNPTQNDDIIGKIEWENVGSEAITPSFRVILIGRVAGAFYGEWKKATITQPGAQNTTYCDMAIPDDLADDVVTVQLQLKAKDEENSILFEDIDAFTFISMTGHEFSWEGCTDLQPPKDKEYNDIGVPITGKIHFRHKGPSGNFWLGMGLCDTYKDLWGNTNHHKAKVMIYNEISLESDIDVWRDYIIDFESEWPPEMAGEDSECDPRVFIVPVDHVFTSDNLDGKFNPWPSIWLYDLLKKSGITRGDSYVWDFDPSEAVVSSSLDFFNAPTEVNSGERVEINTKITNISDADGYIYAWIELSDGRRIAPYGNFTNEYIEFDGGETKDVQFGFTMGDSSITGKLTLAHYAGDVLIEDVEKEFSINAGAAPQPVNLVVNVHGEYNGQTYALSWVDIAINGEVVGESVNGVAIISDVGMIGDTISVKAIPTGDTSGWLPVEFTASNTVSYTLKPDSNILEITLTAQAAPSYVDIYAAVYDQTNNQYLVGANVQMKNSSGQVIETKTTGSDYLAKFIGKVTAQDALRLVASMNGYTTYDTGLFSPPDQEIFQLTLVVQSTTQPSSFTLNVQVAGGSGYVNKIPDQASYQEGATVQIVPVPSAGYDFDYWMIDGQSYPYAVISITMNKSYTCYAYFKFEAGAGDDYIAQLSSIWSKIDHSPGIWVYRNGEWYLDAEIGAFSTGDTVSIKMLYSATLTTPSGTHQLVVGWNSFNW